ncbi:DHA2 family efflux MFS transporter permease subunit [Mycolicibacterium sp. lyk4-40-TYG-92]|uniref:DHA2 family efflux MFS transporter permease subunit n=1 Tax=Mycolicibacterium sp. lyk4-40-TYG-92 TaxID=3040295 RepID=UPI00254A0479|nr:DHA2 family efflux MFS transporter permease subunit [Mycolicibacterium sp. lyk4-40-TYG-92]
MSRAQIRPDATNRAAPIDRTTWRMCWVVVFGAFASGLDASLVNIGLDTISRDLDASLGETQWVASGYLLALGLSLPLAGWLSRRFGTGRVWLTALAGFTLASGLCALAPSIGLLISARVLQGLAGGVLIPAGQTLLGQAVGPDRLGRVMGTLGIAVGAAPAIGPLVGGLLLHALPWPWLFAINLPIGAVGLVLGRRYIPRGVPAETKGIDKAGLALVTIGMPLVVLSLTEWGNSGTISATTAAAAAAGIAALAWFVAHASRTADPLLDVRLYRNAAYRAGAIAAIFSGALVFGSGIVQTLYFQIGRHLDPIHAGLSLFGVAAATVVFAPLTGRWIDRYGPARVSLVGSVIAVATTAPFMILPVDARGWIIQPMLIAYGAAVAMVATPAGVAAYAAVTAAQLPDAITQINIIQRIGGSLGGAICAVLIASRLPNTTAAFHTVFAALTICAVGALGGATLIHRTNRQPNIRA